MSEPVQESATFEQALRELEGIVRLLEDGDTGLEQALAQYEQGIGLLQRCYSQLGAAEQRIQRVSGATADGQALTQPFDHTAALTRVKKRAGQSAEE